MMYTRSFLLALLPSVFAAPLLTAPRGTNVIPGKYIVKLKADASKAALDEAKSLLSSAADHDYEFGGFKGFAGSASTDAVNKLQKLDAVRLPLFQTRDDLPDTV